MAEAWKNYTDRVFDQTGFLGCWPSTGELALGDIVLMEAKRTPVRQLNFTDLGVDVTPREGQGRRDYGANSGTAIEVSAEIGAKGPVHPGVAAGTKMRVTFKRANAVLMRAENCRIDQFDRLDMVKREILERNARKEWDRDYLVISQVAVSERLLVLISERGGANIGLDVSAGIGADSLSLAKGQGTVRLSQDSADVHTENSEEPMTPLYRALKLRKLPRKKVAQANKRGRARAQVDEFDVVEFRY
jgi:hypothetical protein